MRKHLNKLLISYLSALIALPGLGSILSAFSETPSPPFDDSMEHVDCYDMVMPVLPEERELGSLEQSLEILEKEYKDNKINKETYELRKDKLQKQIELLKEGQP